MESQASSLRRLTAALGDCVVAGGEETESAQNALGSNDEARWNSDTPFLEARTRWGDDVAAGPPTELGTASDSTGDS